MKRYKIFDLNEKNIISVSQNLYEEIKEEIGKRNSNKVTEVIENVINRKYANYKMKKMYRMRLDDMLDIDISKVVKVEEKHKMIFLNSKKKRNIDEDEKKWQKFKKYIDLRLLFWNTKC